MFSTTKEKGPMDFLDAMEGRVIEALRTDHLRDYSADEVYLALK